MAERSGIFDMIGPIMVGPSSSHTAGVVRIGRVAHHILGGTPEKVSITFYNSFATTYEGHGSDRAVMAGLMDFSTDDLRIRESLDIARDRNISFKFIPIGSASTLHPNTIKIEAEAGNRKVEVVGESLGGGVINIPEIDGFAANLSAGLQTLIIKADDVKGSIAYLSAVLSQDDCNIATMACTRKAKNDLAYLFFEVDTPIRPLTIQYLRSLSWVHEVIYFKNLK